MSVIDVTISGSTAHGTLFKIEEKVHLNLDKKSITLTLLSPALTQYTSLSTKHVLHLNFNEMTALSMKKKNMCELSNHLTNTFNW